MSKRQTTAAPKASSARGMDNGTPAGKARITPALKEIGERSSLLYREMTGLTLPDATLDVLGDMVRAIDKVRL